MAQRGDQVGGAGDVAAQVVAVQGDVELAHGHVGPFGRGEVMKKLWDYIKAHNLQDPKDKRTIVADDKLRPILGADSVGMFKLAGIVGQHVS